MDGMDYGSPETIDGRYSFWIALRLTSGTVPSVSLATIKTYRIYAAIKF